MFKPRTIIEPFRIKTVEPLPMISRESRCAALSKADFNLFAVAADQVAIDLMTDSGTSAMSDAQWAGIMRGDESYAGGRSYYRFEKVVKDITGMKNVVPTHQGRAAERILFSAIGDDQSFVVANTHFDTTRANVEAVGAVAVDLVIEEGNDPQANHPFKGNIDLDRLSEFLATHHGKVPMVVITVTNNSGGGQPVSLENLRGAREVCDVHEVPLFLDCARFAENAWFIKMREEGYENKTAKEIAQEMFSLADGAWMSAKKDAFGNIGGFLAINNDDLAASCRNLLILTEGFPTYGGLAGRDLEALATGLEEVLHEEYLAYRIRSTEYVWESLAHNGVPLLRPAGGHAVYLDARQFLPHVGLQEFPGQSLSVALYAEGGVRACEIGSVMFGRTLEDGSQQVGPMDLVRLAIPRRVYTQSHMDYVIEVVSYVYNKRAQIGGMKITAEPPALRHFTCSFEPTGWDPRAQ